jgi:uncharacterized protein (DUF362 family)
MAASVDVMPLEPPVVWPAPDYTTVAASIDDLFRFLGLDRRNPLGRWIRPAMTVAIKPNWVKHEFAETEGQNALYTHASVIRVLIDDALAALTPAGRSPSRPAGHVFVADAPLQGCDFARFRGQSGLAYLEKEYAGAPVSFLDLRQQWAEIDDASSFVQAVLALSGDPRGYSQVALGPRSRLACFPDDARFGVTDYPGYYARPPAYPVSNTVLSADVLINLPKLKTHVKAGITGALKNFVGIIGAKDCLPHFRAGSPRQGGDEYPDSAWVSRFASPARALLQSRAPLWLWKLARTGAPAMVTGGAWFGNDTLWRTIHDLVDIARNYAVGGGLRRQPRTILTLVDAVVAGEGCGPLKPRPKHCGCLVWGTDPGLVDITCAQLMGFDWRKIPMLAHLCDAEARAFSSFPGELSPVPIAAAPFQPPPGWAGTIV